MDGCWPTITLLATSEDRYSSSCLSCIHSPINNRVIPPSSSSSRKPILILYGDETPELQQIHTICPHVTAIKIQMTNPFSTHHTKMMLLGYKDKSMRVIISTANLYEDDWRNRTQGIWISPRCYEMDDQGPSSRGESVTGFRADLIRYLNKYSQPRLQEWTARILRTNFEAVK